MTASDNGATESTVSNDSVPSHFSTETRGDERRCLKAAKRVFMSDGSVPWMGALGFLRQCDTWGGDARWDPERLASLAAAMRSTGVILRDCNPNHPDSEFLFEDSLCSALSSYPLWLPARLAKEWEGGGYADCLGESSRAEYERLLASPLRLAAFAGLHENYPCVREAWTAHFNKRRTVELGEVLLSSADKMERAMSDPDFCHGTFEKSAVAKNCLHAGSMLGVTDKDALALARLVAVHSQRDIDEMFFLAGELACSERGFERSTALGVLESGFGLSRGDLRRMFDTSHPFCRAGFLKPFQTGDAGPRYLMDFQTILSACLNVSSCNKLTLGFERREDLLSVFAQILPPPDKGLSLSDFSHVGAPLEQVAKALGKGPARILLWGPPGGGKTQLALLLCKEAGLAAASSMSPGHVGSMSDSNVKSGVERLGNMISSEPFIRAIGKAAVIADECEDILSQEDAKSYITLAMDGSTLPQVWIANDLKGAHPAYLRRFDFVLHVPQMPLWARERLAGAMFGDQRLASRVAQAMHTPAQIRGAYDWCEASGEFGWQQVATKLSGDQKALQAAQATDEGGFAVEVVPPDPDPSKGLCAIAGFPETVGEARAIAHIFESPASYQAVGAKVPKGVILTGPPGSGKTLFARSLANEVGVPVVMAKTGELAEKPERIGELFSEARKRAPCVVFLDEVDALATSPEEAGGTDSEKQRILNRLLVEIDGFDPLEGVMVLAATHRPGCLDKALTRSGRLGRSIVFRHPDEERRKDIWRLYLSKIRFSGDPDMDALARASAGFSAADISEASNQGAIRAGAADRAGVVMGDLLAACDDIFWGEAPSGEPEAVSQQEWTSVHEAGHALVALSFGRRVERATVRPRAGFLGAVHELQSEEGHPPMGRREMFERVCVHMAGIAAEEAVFGRRSSGGGSDLANAGDIVRSAFSSWALGSSAFKNSVWMPSPWHGSPVSEKRLEALEREEEEFLCKAFDESKKWLESNRDLLGSFAKELLDKREMSGADITKWLSTRKLDGKPEFRDA